MACIHCSGLLLSKLPRTLPTPLACLHPAIEVTLQKAPKLALPLTDRDGGQVAFASPTRNGPSVEAAQIPGRLGGSEISLLYCSSTAFFVHDSSLEHFCMKR